MTTTTHSLLSKKRKNEDQEGDVVSGKKRKKEDLIEPDGDDGYVRMPLLRKLHEDLDLDHLSMKPYHLPFELKIDYRGVLALSKFFTPKPSDSTDGEADDAVPIQRVSLEYVSRAELCSLLAIHPAFFSRFTTIEHFEKLNGLNIDTPDVMMVSFGPRAPWVEQYRALSVESLCIDCCSHFSYDTLFSLQHSYLRALYASDNDSEYFFRTVESIVIRAPCLESLYVNSSKSPSQIAWNYNLFSFTETGYRHWEKITSLCLFEARRHRGVKPRILDIAKHCTNLQSLRLAGKNLKVRKEADLMKIQSMKNLRYLDFNLDDDSLHGDNPEIFQKLVAACPRIFVRMRFDREELQFGWEHTAVHRYTWIQLCVLISFCRANSGHTFINSILWIIPELIKPLVDRSQESGFLTWDLF